MPLDRSQWHSGATLQPAAQHPPELLLAAQGIRWAIFDVDGVLTDGRLYIGEHGEQFKAFSTLDGHGLKLLAQGGITPVVITGRDSPAVRRRVAELGIAHAVYGAADKLAAATQLMAQLGLGWDTLCAMGDDWPDLPLLTRAAFACAPANATLKCGRWRITSRRQAAARARRANAVTCS